jgi:hypothetical protein
MNRFRPCPKTKALRDKKYLKWLAAQDPLIGGWGDTVYHHVRMLGNGGVSQKPPDNDCIPIADSVHRDIHNCGEITILVETYELSLDEIRQVCDGYYAKYLKERRRNG